MSILNRIKSWFYDEKIDIRDPKLSEPVNGSGISRRSIILALQQGKQKRGK